MPSQFKHPVVSWYGIGLVIVLLVGAGFYLTGYNYGLPMYENQSERRNIYEVFVQRGLADQELTKPGYPPGILWVYHAAQRVAEARTGQSAIDVPADVIATARLFSIGFSLVAATLFSWIARKMSGDLAALIAPALWLVSPLILERTSDALPQIYETLGYTLALLMALLALEKKQPGWAIGSVLAGIGAILFKYSNFPALGFGVGVALWNALTDRRKWLPVLVGQLLIIVLAAVAIFAFDDIAGLVAAGHRETVAFLEGGLGKIVDLSLGLTLLEMSAAQIGLPLVLVVVALVIGTVLYWRQATANRRVLWVFILIVIFSNNWFITTFVRNIDDSQRYTTPVSGLLVILLAITLVQVARWLGERFHSPTVNRLVLLVLTGVWFVPQLIGGVAWAKPRTLPTTQLALAQWLTATLPVNDTGFLVSDETAFRPFWGGYTGPEHRWFSLDILSRPLTTWRADRVDYAQLTESQIEALQASPEGQAVLDQILPLKQFPPPGEADHWRGFRNLEAAMTLYYLDRMEHETDILFGDSIRLLGYDLSADEALPGETISVNLYWQALTPPTDDYDVFLIAFTDADIIVSQTEAPPAWDGRRPTSTWTDSSEILIGQDFQLTLPDDLAPGRYSLVVGLMEPVSRQTLSTVDRMDFAEFASIAVRDEAPADDRPDAPNLMITDLRLEPAIPQCQQPFTVVATIENTGTQAAPDGLLTAVDRHAASSTEDGQVAAEFPGIQPGGTFTAALELTVDTFFLDTHEVVVTVDADDQIAEGAESDNTWTHFYRLGVGTCP